jgi:hypothetical protein
VPLLGTTPQATKHTVRLNADQELAFCVVDVINDSQYEEDETFSVYLDRVVGGRLIPGENWTTVTIAPDAADGTYATVVEIFKITCCRY